MRQRWRRLIVEFVVDSKNYHLVFCINYGWKRDLDIKVSLFFACRLSLSIGMCKRMRNSRGRKKRAIDCVHRWERWFETIIVTYTCSIDGLKDYKYPVRSNHSSSSSSLPSLPSINSIIISFAIDLFSCHVSRIFSHHPKIKKKRSMKKVAVFFLSLVQCSRTDTVTLINCIRASPKSAVFYIFRLKQFAPKLRWNHSWISSKLFWIRSISIRINWPFKSRLQWCNRQI